MSDEPSASQDAALSREQPTAGTHGSARANAERVVSDERRAALRFEQLLTAALALHEEDSPDEALRGGARAVVACVDADWAVVDWQEPHEVQRVARSGHEVAVSNELVLGLSAPRPSGERRGTLRVGRHAPPFDGVERALVEAAARMLSSAVERACRRAADVRLNRGRDEVLAAVAHDLRKLASIVLASATELLEASSEPAAVRALAGGIACATGRMSRLLTDLLDSAQAAAGRLAVVLERTDVAEFVGEAAHAARPLARASGIGLLVDSVPRGLEVWGDRERLLQVLANLLGNALKFTPSDGAVRLAVEPRDTSVRFVVSDTGPGIPRALRRHVFTRFWKASTSGEGAGLGLHISKEILEAHRGTLVLDPGDRGASFSFELPRCVPAGDERSQR